MKKKLKAVEYHDVCPKCKRRMKEVKDPREKNIFYFCKKCNQKYRIAVVHHYQELDCPYCKKTLKISEKVISQLHMNATFNYDIRKIKVKP